MATADGAPQSARWIAVVAQAIEHARAATHPAALGRTRGAITEELEAIETDLAQYAAPFLTELSQHPGLAPQVRDALATIVAPAHQSQLAIAFAGVYALIRQLVDAAIEPYAQSVSNHVWPLNPVMPLSPAEVALGMLRHNPHIGDPYTEAAQSGVSGGRLDALAYNTGDAIPIQEALLLFRRGQIDQARLETALRESRVRDEWLPEVLALRYAPPGPGEVISGALKQHLSTADAQAKLAEAGIDPANFGWLVATAGRPYGIEQGLDLLNRGVIDETRMRQVVAQSDVNPDYTDDILHLRVYLPPPRSIVAMLRNGALGDAEATTLLEQHGVPANIVSLFLNEAHHTTTQQARDVTQAQVLRFYGASLISRADAQARLALLHYDATSIGLLLDYEDMSRVERYMNAVITRVHARYVTYKITEPEALSALGADGITGTAATQLLDVWNIERSVDQHNVTPAEVVHAYRQGVISPAEAKARLLAAGVAPADLAIIVTSGYPPNAPNTAAVLAVVNA